MDTLDQMPVGASGVLGEPDVLYPTLLRLLEMGLTPGAEVWLCRRAPLGDPIEVEVRGVRLCLRRGEARHFPVSIASPGQRP